jgi:hypothetical protein
MYLELLRAERLADHGLDEEQREWWRCQRTHGLVQAARLGSEKRELDYIAARLKTHGGIRRLQREILAAQSSEFKIAA